MAAQFVQEHNQKLLWKIINNTPQMIQVFEGSAQGDKEAWFNKIIRHLYNEHIKSTKVISLRDINKHAVDFMLKILQRSLLESRQHPVTDIQTFEMRKKEYDSLVNKQQPKADFTESIKDEAIGDINAALNDYVKQRESVLPLEDPQKQPQKKQVTWANEVPLNEVPLNEVPLNEVANEVSSNEKPINKKMSWKSELQEVQMHISDEPEIKNLLNKLIEKTDYQISLLERLLQNKDNKINIENS